MRFPVLGDIGRTFNGWFTSSAGGTRVAFNDGRLVEAWSYDSDITVYAQWTTTNYTLSFVNGYTHSNPSKISVDDLPLNLKNASRSGYQFIGWYSDSSYENKITSITAATIQALTGTAITLYGNWNQLFTVSLYVDGNLYESHTGVKNSTFTLSGPTKGGYKGSWGWGGGTVSNFGKTYTISGTARLDVVWITKTLNECYNSSNGSYEIWGTLFYRENLLESTYLDILSLIFTILVIRHAFYFVFNII